MADRRRDYVLPGRVVVSVVRRSRTIRGTLRPEGVSVCALGWAPRAEDCEQLPWCVANTGRLSEPSRPSSRTIASQRSHESTIVAVHGRLKTRMPAAACRRRWRWVTSAARSRRNTAGPSAVFARLFGLVVAVRVTMPPTPIQIAGPLLVERSINLRRGCAASECAPERTIRPVDETATETRSRPQRETLDSAAPAGGTACASRAIRAVRSSVETQDATTDRAPPAALPLQPRRSDQPFRPRTHSMYVVPLVGMFMVSQAKLSPSFIVPPAVTPTNVASPLVEHVGGECVMALPAILQGEARRGRAPTDTHRHSCSRSR